MEIRVHSQDSTSERWEIYGERLLPFRNVITNEASLILMKAAPQVWNVMPLVIDNV
jgi:hypothetical protein